jgi:hypothetical protein
LLLKGDREVASACGFKRETPSHGLFTQFRRRLGKGRYEKVFSVLLKELLEFGVVNGKSVALDSTAIKGTVKEILTTGRIKAMLTPGLEEEEKVLC